MRNAPRVSVPDRAHPVVKKLFQEMQDQQISVLDMADKSGINKNTLKDWRTRTTPRIADIEACFGVLGMKLIVVTEE